MAPVACITDLTMPRTDAAYPYTRRRQRNRLTIGIVEKYRTLETRQMSIARFRVGSPHDTATTPSFGEISDTDTSTDANFQNNQLQSSLLRRIPIERDDQWIILKRRADLLNIVARTIDLIRRNHILEKKVEALKRETQNFVNSVLANPENRTKHVRRGETSFSDDDTMKDCVSSTTDEIPSWSRTAVNENIEKSRRTIFDDRDKEHFGKLSLKRDTRSSDEGFH